MFSRSIAVAALLLLPTIGEAQRRTRGSPDANWDDVAKKSSAVPKIEKRDLENFSAIKLIVDKRKDLKLSNDQVKQFSDLSKKEDEANESRYKQVDSLRNAMRKRPGEPEDQERVRTSLARQDLMSVIGQVRANYDSTFQHGLSLLDDTQKKAASDLVEKRREKAEKDIRDELGGGMQSAPTKVPFRVGRPTGR